MLSKVPNERLQGFFGESLTHPVERWAEIVYELLTRVRGAHFLGKRAGLHNVGFTSLDPEQIGEGSELLSALSCGGESGIVVVESFAGPGAVARPDNRGFRVVVGESTTTRE